MIAYSTVNNTTFRDTYRFICNYMINYCSSITSSSGWFINQLRKAVFSINSVYVFNTILCRYKRITIYVSDCDAFLVFIIKSVEQAVNKIKDLNRYSRGRYNAVTMSGLKNRGFTSIEIDSNSQTRSNVLMNGISLCTYSATLKPWVFLSFLTKL